MKNKIPAPLLVSLVSNPTGRPTNRPTSKQTSKLIATLLGAQNNHCGICGLLIAADQRTSLDHTFPVRFCFFNNGNMTATHYQCNHAKDNRLPSGCELIWLLVANSALIYYPPKPNNHGFWSYSEGVPY